MLIGVFQVGFYIHAVSLHLLPITSYINSSYIARYVKYVSPVTDKNITEKSLINICRGSKILCTIILYGRTNTIRFTARSHKWYQVGGE